MSVNIYILFQQNKEGEPWKEMQTDANSSSIDLQNLEYDSEYQVEVTAVNINGLSKSAQTHFSIPQGEVYHSTLMNFSSLRSH